MLHIVYSGKSAPSAHKLAEESGDINISRSNTGNINWGRATADTELNPDISKSTNKRVMRELFAVNDVPAPTLFDDVQAMDAVLSGKVVVGRPDQHSKGRGYWLCKDLADIKQALAGGRRKQAATHFLEFIEAPHELRIHVFKGKSIRVSEKAHTEFHKYTTIKPTVNVKQARKAAKKAVAALGLDFGTVDILALDDGTPYVLEVNAAPGLGGSMPRVWAQTFLAWQNGEWDD